MGNGGETMIELGKWKLSTPNKHSIIYLSENGNEYLIRSKNNDLAEVTYSGADIVISTGDTKIAISPESLSIQISPLKFI